MPDFGPLYSGYIARQKMNQDTETQNLGQLVAGQGLLAKLVDQQRENQYRAAIDGLGANATPDQLLQASRPYMNPGQLATLIQGSEDRKLTRDNTREIALSRLQQTATNAAIAHSARMATLTRQEDRDAETKRHNLSMETLNREALQFTGRRLFNDERRLDYEVGPITGGRTPPPVPGMPPVVGGMSFAPQPPDANFLQSPSFQGLPPQMQEMLKSQIMAGGAVRVRQSPEGAVSDVRGEYVPPAGGQSQSQIAPPQSGLATLLQGQAPTPAAPAAPVDREMARLPTPANPGGLIDLLAPTDKGIPAGGRDGIPVAPQAPAAGLPAPVMSAATAPTPVAKPEAVMPKFTGSPQEVARQQNLWLQEKNKPAPTVKVVPDKNSSTGFSYQDMRNPGVALSPAPDPQINSGNNNANTLSRMYSAHPAVKQYETVAPGVTYAAQYMASIPKNGATAADDAALTKMYIAMTHPKGDQISNLDMKTLAAQPDLPDRIKVAINGFINGKTLADATRAEFWGVISNKFKALDAARTAKRQEIESRARTMNVDVNAIFGQPAQ